MPWLKGLYASITDSLFVCLILLIENFLTVLSSLIIELDMLKDVDVEENPLLAFIGITS